MRIIVPENPANTLLPHQVPLPPRVLLPPITRPYHPPPPRTAPPIQASGKLSPAPGDTIDLDNLTLNSGDEDLLYQEDANNYHWLTPEDEAMIGVFSNQEPSLPECQSASMSHAPIAVESLPVGTYLCYTTNEGRLGRALLEAVDPNNFTLTLDLLTWVLP